MMQVFLELHGAFRIHPSAVSVTITTWHLYEAVVIFKELGQIACEIMKRRSGHKSCTKLCDT
eukprot:m.121197 g.121197  ORF g.121197 m.121197 type:complete len:62 (+) comp17269_c0_seq3:3495-3680(+)